MTALVERYRCGRSLCLLVLVLSTVFMPGRSAFAADPFGANGVVRHAASAEPAGNGDKISVILDQSRLIKLPERAATLVIGNPLIADVSIQREGLLVVTGKGYGVTNLIALDKSGATLMERLIQVKGPYASTVVVYRGMLRETHSCAPFCEPRVTLGDGSEFFRNSLGQTVTWTEQVNAAAQLGSKDADDRDRDRDRERDRERDRDRALRR